MLLDEKILIRYLLDDLPDKDRDRIESLYFVDDKTFELLEVIEGELEDLYARGLLSSAEMKLFEAKYLRRDQGKRRVAFARNLGSSLSKSSPAHDQRIERSSGLANRWETFIIDLVDLRPAFKFGLGLAVVTILLGGWLMVQYASLHRSWQTLDHSTAVLEQEIATERMRNTQLTEQLEGEREEKQVKGQNPGSDKDTPILALVLSPGLLREAGEQQTLLLRGNTAVVKFELDLEGSDTYRSYRAELKSAGNNILWATDGLLRRDISGAGQVALPVDASVLRPGNYRINLYGHVGGDSQMLAGEYSFAVRLQ